MIKKRKYEKKSDFWKGKGSMESSTASQKAFEPLMSGEEMSFASSSARAGEATISGRRNRAASSSIPDTLSNIWEMGSPYNYDGATIEIKDAITLCQKAYANIGLFRNTIDVMTEFSNTPVRVRGGNKESRKFIKAWLEKIKIAKVGEQFFREHYRSGNTFLFKMEGALDLSSIKDSSKVYAALSSQALIPLKYTIINPASVILQGASSFIEPSYRKVLSKYEIDALASPKTPEDKAIFDALPEDVKIQISKKSSSINSEIYLPIDPKKLYPIFYKKQDYEPFAVPFGFPVLKDFNFKLELKKIDLAIARTIQNVSLLITMGEQGANGKASINAGAMAKMQELFTSQSVARVIVSDYTTKAQFLVPEVGNILDPKKYEVVERDIREGLMLLIGGEGEKFSNQESKVKIFIARLNEGRKAFIGEFLQQEVKALCKAVGFKNYPEVYFEEIKFRDDVQFNRIYTRLLELGVLTPEQMIDAVQTGVLPEQEGLVEGQEEYIVQRKKGMFNPLIAGTPFIESAEGKANRKVQTQLAEQGIQSTTKKTKPPEISGSPNPNTPNSGRPPGSIANLKSVIQDYYNLSNLGESLAKDRFGVKELNKSQKDSVLDIVESIMSSSVSEKWESNLSMAFKDFSSISRDESVLEGVEELASREEIDVFAAAILFHSYKK